MRTAIRLVAPLAAAFLIGLTPPADAGEVVKLRNGDMIPGDVLSVDDDGCTFRPEKGGEARILWAQVLPVSRYELWGATLAADDVDARTGLARWAFSVELFHQARREILGVLELVPEVEEAAQPDTSEDDSQPAADGDAEVAEAGADVAIQTTREELESLLDEIDRTQADMTLARVDDLVRENDPNAAMDVVRHYLRVAPPGEHTDRVRSRVADLLVRIERNEEASRESADQAKADAKDARKERWIKANLESAIEEKQEAAEEAIEGFGYLAKGNQTRARRAMGKAEKGFVKARDVFKKVRRVVSPTSDEAAICKREMEDADRRTVDVLTRWGQLEVDNKSWKRASAAVDRGLRIDAVNTELLELRRIIDENWIRRRASDITNATGRETQ